MVDDESPDGGLRAGELARRTGVSKDTLRYYERQGLLPRPRRLANNYRAYPPEAEAQVRWVRRALAAGLSVEELAEVLAERRRGGVPCRRVRELGAARLAEVEERLRELATVRDGLRSMLVEWDRRLSATPPGERAGLLDSLEYGQEERPGGAMAPPQAGNGRRLRKETER